MKSILLPRTLLYPFYSCVVFSPPHSLLDFPLPIPLLCEDFCVFGVSQQKQTHVSRPKVYSRAEGLFAVI